MMDTFNGALTLNRNLLQTLRESLQVVQRGLLVVLLVGLLVGGVNGVRSMIYSMNPDLVLNDFRTEFERFLDQQALISQDPNQRLLIGIMRENLEPGLAIAREISALPTPLPRPVGAVVQGLATLVSTPLAYLASLLLWVIFTHIAARWLGGQGNIQQMLGLGALSVAPHALDALAFVPGVGVVLVWIARIWGIVVLIIAAGVAHRLEGGRATLAVLFFPFLGLLALILGCCVLFILTALAATTAG